ncbi:amidohydrolase family protein [Mucilaginibacter gotjawali]|uniref:Cytosine/adenosine deaminase-related metal-dependent hydrolase n=1 Tax=Mucilaginibacter gotjawali TaxID=1550579 RepID=A0A839S9Y6_9SPHI|nr:amidohydrolase family protein [Mucilaginibacter gotjawali]MBB3054646.1 cytosine/adenosine deaminase-related metal-dependent hydrolase [Mucilaginibacter gotjawali]
MKLNNLKMAGTDEVVDVGISGEQIANVSSNPGTTSIEEIQITFRDALVFPGLINSHDHLDFNLFQQLGTRIYSNYTEWGKDIHQAYKTEIAAVLKVPEQLRSVWGVYKNLLGGVTTVVNHGEKQLLEDAPLTVFENSHCLHSVKFEKGWKIKLNNPLKIKLPVNIHIGEGVDWPSYDEIDQLTRWNLLRKKLIGVHAVAMSEAQAKNFEAIVWCPQSNYFLLNQTAQVNGLKNSTRLLFGTDSTLTSHWDIWEHLRSARATKQISDAELFQTVNQNASKTWLMNNGEVAAGKDADIVIAKIKDHKKGFDAFFAITPADLLLVMHKGNIRLFDETILGQLKNIHVAEYSKVYINGVGKYVQGDLPGLMEKIKEYYPAVRFPLSANN